VELSDVVQAFPARRSSYLDGDGSGAPGILAGARSGAQGALDASQPRLHVCALRGQVEAEKAPALLAEEQARVEPHAAHVDEPAEDRKITRLNSSHVSIVYA